MARILPVEEKDRFESNLKYLRLNCQWLNRAGGSGPPARTKCKSELHGVIEQGHEAEIHVQLLMAVKQGEAGIIGNEVDLDGLNAMQYSITELRKAATLRVVLILPQAQDFWIKHQWLQSSVSDLFFQHRDIASKMLFFPVAFKIIKGGEPGALIDGVTLDEMWCRPRVGTHHEEVGTEDDAGPSRQLAVQPAPREQSCTFYRGRASRTL